MVSAQLALTMRRNKLVSATGEDIYLPDSDEGLKSSVYKKHIERLDLPIRFIVGELTLYYPIPYHTIPYNTIQCNTIPYHTIPYHDMP